MPTEDEEVPDFATPFVKQIAHRRLKPKIISRLCDSCINIPIKRLLESPRNSHLLFRDARKLKESTESCDLCKLILRSIEDLCNNDATAMINIVISPQFLVIEVIGMRHVDYRVLRLCTDPGSEAVRMGIEIGLSIQPEPGSELHFRILKEWLEDCDKYHNDHKFGSEGKELLTRVLDVQTQEGLDTLRLREIKREAERERGRYIALSHRWGEDQSRKRLSTTKGNKEAHYEAIKFDDLPKTFQDAVTVTRELGIRYLWIDSLCIVQDDTEDWEEESKRMHSVFANAFCTIAATSAKDSWEGFLFRQGVTQPVKLVDRSAHPPFHVYACEVGGNFDGDVVNGGLNRRAWVLQERALSRRTIHFTAAQTYWECGSVIRCESLVQMVKPADLLSSSQFPMTTSGLPEGGAASAFEDIFARYSKLNLTYETDRPYAITGLQNRLEGLYKTESTVGIVYCCLLKSLLWQRAGTNMIKIDPETVPSWSWMNYRGGIRYGKFPKVDISWNRDVKLIPTGNSGSNNQEKAILVAIVVPIPQEYKIEQWQNTDRKINDAKNRLVGWVRFDTDTEVGASDLGCIIIAQHKSNGWMGLSQDSWKDFAAISGCETLNLNGLSYILIVSNASHEQGYKVEVCRRLGVGIIEGKCFSFSSSPRAVWVL